MAGQRPPDNPARRVRPAGQWEVFCSRHALHAEREGHSLAGIRTPGLHGAGLTALFPLFFASPGALPQAGMDRACGPLETVPMVDPHLKERTRAPKARTISAWGNAPGTVETKKEQGL